MSQPSQQGNALLIGPWRLRAVGGFLIVGLIFAVSWFSRSWWSVESAPLVRVEIVQHPDAKNDLVLAIYIAPPGKRPEQKLSQVTLMLDDYRYDKPPQPNKLGVVDESKFVIPRDELRIGTNRITVQCDDAQGDKGEASVLVEFDDGVKSKPDLYALCVGINNYERVKNFQFKSLNCAKPDAEAMAEVLKQHKGSALYRNSVVDLVPETEATAAEITARLKKLGSKARRDDWFVLFLSGHGHAKIRLDETSEPGSFFYLCADSNPAVPDSMLTSQKLYSILAGIRCRKLIILDAARSGDVASNPSRDLTRDRGPLLVFSACGRSQSANEPLDIRFGKHGLFTQCLLDVLGDPAATKGKKRLKVVTALELSQSIRSTLPKLLKSLDVDEDDQTPVFYPARPPALAVFCRP